MSVHGNVRALQSVTVLPDKYLNVVG